MDQMDQKDRQTLKVNGILYVKEPEGQWRAYSLEKDPLGHDYYAVCDIFSRHQDLLNPRPAELLEEIVRLRAIAEATGAKGEG